MGKTMLKVVQWAYFDEFCTFRRFKLATVRITDCANLRYLVRKIPFWAWFVTGQFPTSKARKKNSLTDMS